MGVLPTMTVQGSAADEVDMEVLASCGSWIEFGCLLQLLVVFYVVCDQMNISALVLHGYPLKAQL